MMIISKSSKLLCRRCSALVEFRKPSRMCSFSKRTFSITSMSSRVTKLSVKESSFKLTPYTIQLPNLNYRLFCSTKYRLANSDRTKSSSDLPDLDAPIQFTTSKASEWKAEDTHINKAYDEMPWFQPYVVLFSVTCLLIWFGILREENDIDEEIGKPLWERIPGLEEKQLRIVIKYNREHDLPTADLEKRLTEIQSKSK